MQHLAIHAPGRRIARIAIPAATAFILLLLQLAGCAGMGAGSTQRDVRQFLHDDAFPGSAEYVVESRKEVFHLDRAARLYLDRNINSIRDYHDRGRTLIDEIFRQAALNVSYASNANTTASETFHRRTANCLSMSIMAYAMAEYTGFDATFQEVDIPEYWERRQNFSLMNRHINLSITPRAGMGTTVMRKVVLEVDFQPIAGLHNPPTRTVSPRRALAMFYNNKGVDALLVGRHDAAYAYFRAALLEDSTLDMAYTNLGLLYGVNGYRGRAEASYREANRLNPGNAIAAEYLALLLRMSGRSAEADVIEARLARTRRENPYYFYILGEEAYDAGHWREAIRWFEKAIALQPKADEFHFGMARSYAKLGDSDRAASYLRRAERHAVHADLKQKYRDKLSSLPDL